MLQNFAKSLNFQLIAKYFIVFLTLLFSTYVCALLRGIKDTLLVTSLGAEEISFIKFYGVMPASFIFFLTFTKLANLYSREILYRIIILFFIFFFCAYLVAIQFEEELVLNLDSLIASYPKYHHLFRLIENWTLSLFYIISEICGTVILTLLFWQVANDLYTIKQAEKNYFTLGIVGQLGIIFAGFLQNKFSNTAYKDNGLHVMIITVILSLSFILILYSCIFKKSSSYKKNNNVFSRTKLSLLESIKLTLSSKYLVLIMMVVFSYGLSANLIDILWKSQLKAALKSFDNYSLFIGNFNIALGFTSIFCMLIGRFLINRFSWYFVALFSPVVLGVFGILFIFLIKYQSSYIDFTLLFGTITIILFKSLNYAFIDTTKEIAFIPLNKELKIKGKAAVDVLGARFGKATGSLVQQFLLLNVSSQFSFLTNELLLIFILSSLIWIVSVVLINKRLYN